MSTETKKLIVVIGMHRTGTSLITRGLQVMGVNLGDNLLPAMADVNAKGFWEDADINALNISMLHAIGSEWDYLTPITDANVQQLQQQGFFLQAVELLRQKTAQVHIFGLKDPRIAKLLPFWDRVFSHCHYDVSYLLTVRHPLSVVKSLQKRDGFVAEKAYLLWFTHVVTALTFSNKENLCVVDYDFFMQHSRTELARLAREINLPIIESELEPFVNEFLDNSLRHTQYQLSDLYVDNACPSLVAEMYRELLNVASNQISLTDLKPKIEAWYESLLFAEIPFGVIDDLSLAKSVSEEKLTQSEQLLEQKNHYIENLEKFTRERAEQVEMLYRDLDVLEQQRFAQVKKLDADILERDEHIKKLDEQIALLTKDLNLSYEHSYNLNAHIQLITNSFSWRLTKPLRFLMRLSRHGLSVEEKSRILLGLRALNQRLPSLIQNTNRAVFGGLVRSFVNRSTPLITADSIDSDTYFESKGKSSCSSAVSSGKDFVVWGVIDWHFRHQRPQQIAQALAEEGDRVFYISSNLIEAKTSGFAIEPLGKNGRLFQVHLCVKAQTVIYHHAPSAEATQQLLASVGELLLWAKTQKVVNLVQHPFWYPIAQKIPNSQLVYDCMDHHEGFENTGKEVIDLERALFGAADLTVTTSGFLDDIVAKHTTRREIIRNAGEYEYFSKRPAEVFKDAKGRKIIGYYGAIAEWFDIELIRLLAQQFNDCLIMLVGADTVNAKSHLKTLPNIVFVGEVPYQKLTHYLYAFDVCLLPFKVIPLILATNPVKVYEYLGAGKPVVAVDVPEIKQFGNLVRVGVDHQNFVKQVESVLSEPETESTVAERKKFAEQQTWHHRAKDLSKALSNLHSQPKVSVIVVTYNNLDLTKQCLNSLDKYTDYNNVEIIVVDNASSDDSPVYLTEWAKQSENRILILNQDNKGFAAGNNQGLVVASGEYRVLLNNDTHVTPGWLSSMVKHMQHNPSIGLLGPVTGNIGNEAKIAIQYSSMDEMLVESGKFTLRHIGQLTPLRTAAFFCVMISPDAYEKVGLLDEAFGIGFFEDDDYCRRVEQAGFSICCADDVFIHHHLSASFNKLKLEARQKLFEQNKVIYEKKWGPWVPHSYRPGVN